MNEKIPRNKHHKAFARIRIKSRVQTNPDSYKQPESNFFSTIKNVQSLLNVNRPSSNNRTNSKMTLRSSKTQKNNDSYYHFSRNKPKFDSLLKSELSFNEPLSNKASHHAQRQQKSRVVTQGSLHINYGDYEKIINKIGIDPGHFQKIASRNDNKYEHVILIAETITKYMLKMKKDEDKRLLMTTLNKSAQKDKERLKIVKPKVKNQNTILGTQLGANSLKMIKEKLQQKWTKEQRQKMEQHVHSISDQSDTEQQKKDTKELTNKPEKSNPTSVSKKFKSNPPSLIYLDKIQNKGYRQTLKNIFQKKKDQKIIQQSFNENEYSNQEENLLNFVDIYKKRSFLLKHKMEWKV